MPTYIQGPRIANTIAAPNTKYFGHWFSSDMKEARQAARAYATAQGYYERHKTF